MEKILLKQAKDSETGLNHYRRREGYWHNEVAKTITVFYEEFVETPKGQVYVTESKQHVIKDEAAVLDEKGVEITPAITAYTDHCAMFGAETIGTAIDEFLRVKP